MMKKKYLFNINHLVSIVTILSLSMFTSCTSTKNMAYFQNIQKDTVISGFVTNDFELKIRKNDMLGIHIISRDEDAPLYNGIQTSAVNTGNGTTGIATGFLVDNQGNIEMYKLGKIHVEGLTTKQLRDKLEQDLNITYKLFKDAIVTVKFLNNQVTILGEIARPQVLNMPFEQLTLLDALGMSGDIPITGRKDNVLIIRTTETGKKFHRVNLGDNSIFNSEYYYLKPDDVVYVEPTLSKVRNSGNTSQLLGYALSALSILITVIANIFK